jgi:maleate cis-trans isomerase
MSSRRRIGVLLPSTNTTVEPDFYRVAPAGVSIHAQRLWATEEMTPGSADGMNAEIEDAARYLATAAVEIIGYCCTGGTFYRGPAYDAEVVRRIAEAARVRAVSTAAAIADALRSIGARRISVVTPYLEWENERLRAYYETLGFEVLGVEGDPQASALGYRGICDCSPQSVLEFALTACAPEADALVCSCTAWRSLEVVAELERRLARPVVTANQATIWALFTALGITDPRPGFGSLIEALATRGRAGA